MGELIEQIREIIAPGGNYGISILAIMTIFGLYLLATGTAHHFFPVMLEAKTLTIEEEVKQEVEEERQTLLQEHRSRNPVYKVAFLEKNLRPIVEEWGKLLQQLFGKLGVGTAAQQELERKLDLLGKGESVASFYGQKLVVGVVGLILLFSVQLSGIIGTPPLLAYLVAFAGGFSLPNLSLSGQVKKMRAEIVEQLPAFIDLFSVYVHSGSGLDQALVRVAASGSGALPSAILRASTEAQTIELLRQARRGSTSSSKSSSIISNATGLLALQDFEQGAFSLGSTANNSVLSNGSKTNSSSLMIRALYHMAARFRVPELDDFVAALDSSQTKGLKITEVTQNMAEVMRDKKKERLTAEGKKSIVKMMIPVVVCILPAFFLLILAPALLHLLELIG